MQSQDSGHQQQAGDQQHGSDGVGVDVDGVDAVGAVGDLGDLGAGGEDDGDDDGNMGRGAH